MPRKYNRTIRFYDSWFGDLLDPTKELTPAECWDVILAIRECQLQGTLEPLHALPLATRRALSMETMGEMIERILERVNNRKDISSKGGQETARRRRTEEEVAAARLREERENQERQQRELKYQEQRANAITREQYLELKKRASAGDEEARRLLNP